MSAALRVVRRALTTRVAATAVRQCRRTLLRRSLSTAGNAGRTGSSGNGKWGLAAVAIGSAAAAALYLQQQPSAQLDSKAAGATAVSRFTTPEDEQLRAVFVDAVAPATAGAAVGIPPAEDPSQSVQRRFADVITRAQNHICAQVEALEIGAGSTARFVEERMVDGPPAGAAGAAPVGAGASPRRVYKITRVMQDGKVFDKAGCSITCTRMPYPAALSWLTGKVDEVPALKPVVDQLQAYTKAGGATQTAVPAPNLPFFTAALSLVFHPSNPHAPTVHMNVRYFEIDVPNGERVWWFGGGSDLTPKYLYEEDATHFHSTLAAAANRFDPRYYPAYKQWADRYFNLPHRGNERRGVGGIFFDHFGATGNDKSLAHGKTPSQALEFVAATANAMAPAYFPVVARRKDTPFDASQAQWQRLRHGRYVEFNLMHDEGTKYGLANSAAATEAILMSLPRDVSYRYKFVPKPGSPEAKLQAVLLQPREWLPSPAADAANSTAAVSSSPARS